MMREYQEGDDLRRIHWASVARTGQLMIRQDEASRRASGLVFVDTRAATLGQMRSPSFERGVSVAATLGTLLVRNGFQLRLGTADVQPAQVTEDRFMDVLAGARALRCEVDRPLARAPASRRLRRHLSDLHLRPPERHGAALVDP